MSTELDPRFVADLDRRMTDIAPMLPATIRPDHFRAGVLAQVFKNPGIVSCNVASIWSAFYGAASLGLDLNPAAKLAHVLPYKGKAQLIVGYQGFIELAYRCEEVAAIECDVVREGDDFAFKREADATRFSHMPNWLAREPGELVATYAVCRFHGGGVVAVVLPRWEVLAIKAKSPSAGASFSPWNDKQAESEMWKKTAIRRLAKLIPQANELRHALQLTIAEVHAESTARGGRQRGPTLEAPKVQAPTVASAPGLGYAQPQTVEVALEPEVAPDGQLVPAGVGVSTGKGGKGRK